MTAKEMLLAKRLHKDSDLITIAKATEVANEYADQETAPLRDLLTEVRQKMLFDVDENGQPNSSIIDLVDMWTRVDKLITK